MTDRGGDRDMIDASPAGSLQIEPLGEAAVLLRFGERIDAALNRRVHVLTAHLQTRRPAWLVDIVAAYASLALYIDLDAFTMDADPLTEAGAWLRLRLDEAVDDDAEPTPRLVEIPVHYGGEDGPDLAELAQAAGISESDAIARHVRADYSVAMLGFAAGFPYLLGLDSALAMPRREVPRTRVPAGSVAIGGAQTGVYPRESPGGWRIIGRTSLTLFDPARDPPALLSPGDRVRFVEVAADEVAHRHRR